MKTNAFPSRGFSLIELMVTLALVAILMAVATPSFLAFQRNSELSSYANNMVASINAARGEAMKRGRRAMIRPTDGANWSSGWVVFIDIDHNNAYSSTTDVTIATATAPPSHLSVSGNQTASGSTPYILFNESGYPRTTTGGFGALTINIDRHLDATVSTSQQSEQTRRIKITSVGRVRSCKPSTDTTCDFPSSE